MISSIFQLKKLMNMENLLVYHVDIGRWITCDFSMLNKTVAELKQQIEKKTDIPVNKQVLLVSGGGHLDPSKPVSCYCAGTDTSPFFLFSKSLIDHSDPPTAYFHNRPDIDFIKEHRGTQGMNPTIEALNVRVTLAQQYNENAQYNLNCIDILINDQHMMHQGWSAAVANMLDTVEKFKFKAEIFENDFKRYLEGREESMNLLNNFNNILSEIAKIPMLPALLENNAEERAHMDLSTVSMKNVNQSLLEWVTAREGLHNFEHIVEHCEHSLKQFDESMLNAVLQEVTAMNNISSRSDCSEIKGLEHRLFKLAQMMDESKRLAAEQSSLYEAIKMNHAKAANEGDVSVISVLLASHDKQLEMMNKNNLRLCDIRNRSIRAKQELCYNLHPRLKWLIVVENKVSDVEAIMLLYSDSIKLTREYLDVVEQLNNTPKLYFNAVAEVVRRRIFSQALLIWSSDLACHMIARHSDEIAKRKNFHSQFEGHFLNPLFPGLEDMPPPFATQAPSIFDNNLPKLCLEDLDLLIKQLPRIANIISVPNFNAITQFFLSKSILEDGTLAIEGNNDHKSVAMETSNVMISNMDIIEEKLNEVMTAVGLGSCQVEMQQETEVVKRTHSEMENDSYSPDSSSMVPHKYIGSQNEHAIQILQNNLYTLGNVANNSIKSLRSDLNEFKQYFVDQNLEMDMLTNDLQLKYNIQNTQLRQLMQYVQASNHKMSQMRNRMNELESLLEIHIKNEEHERQLRLRLESERDEWMQRELEHARKEISNELTMVHKKELEMMQVRFKLVTQATNMERSLSEQSLEKNKLRHDVIELVNHEAMMAQLKEDLLLEKEQAIQEVQRNCEQKIARERQMMLNKCDEKRDDQIISLWGDKNRTSKYFKEKSGNELKSTSKFGLTAKSNSIAISDWELDNVSATNSVFVDLSKSSSSESEEGKLSISSCNVGDFVLVMWDAMYKNYVVYQENKKTLVFLHPDSIDSLSLKISSDEIPTIHHFSAEVLQKEYCQAVKEENRYKVPKGTKFYRVKIQLLKPPNPPKRTVSLSDSSCLSVTYVQ
ncbi:RB1-inducible coiled-coil protein 1 [Adelges cooleyi]|uniref:RB1-inducible coiled-coil protein 1 n=1 Tax=Adelges cooleyi TaxID=133065 RepID=UPI0021806BAD|nr:RB1-inducible coiled-coil protein 1 [Adelges cooleyi]XP_050438840.1 RB1-inducible coiled-coil protein 1 [Adelges cooleyi]